MRTFFSLLAAGLLVVLGGAVAQETALEKVDIREWKIPYEHSRPRDPFAQNDKSVWFVGQRAGYLAHLDTISGEIEKIDLKKGSAPHNLIVGSDGIVWYAGNRTGLIGRYDPTSDEIEEILLPDSAALDPHTLVFDKEEKNIWFTLLSANMVGRLNLDTRKVKLIAAETDRARPYGIKMAPDGSVWVALSGTNKLGRINPDTLVLEEIDLPEEGIRPRRLEITSDGRVWYGDYVNGRLGVYDPATRETKEYELPPGENARPYGAASDSKGRIWIVATGPSPNIFFGFNPGTEEFFSATDVPSGGGKIRHMHYHEPSGAVWFGTDTDFVGRAIVEPAVEQAQL